MSKKLDNLLTSGSIIEDMDQIRSIVTELLDSPATSLMNRSPGIIRDIADCCDLDPACYDKLLLREVIALLYSAHMFGDLATEMEDGTYDNYIYPRTLSFLLLDGLFMSRKTDSELLASFFNIGFYKYSQFITMEISKTDPKAGASICGTLMRLLSDINDGSAPENDATLGDVVSMLHQVYFHPWYPGAVTANDYLNGILRDCGAAWGLIILYPHEAFRPDVGDTLKKYYQLPLEA